MWLNYGVPKVERPDAQPAAGSRQRSALRRGRHDRRAARTSPRARRRWPPPTRRRRAARAKPTTTPRATRSAPQASCRTDFAANYSRAVGCGRAQGRRLFVQAQVLNIFNEQDLCGCGGTIFQNGGNGQLNTIQGASAGESVLTPLNTATLARVQPADDGAGAGHELELQRELRHAEESLRVHVAASVPAHVRGAGSKKGTGAENAEIAEKTFLCGLCVSAVPSGR